MTKDAVKLRAGREMQWAEEGTHRMIGEGWREGVGDLPTARRREGEGEPDRVRHGTDRETKLPASETGPFLHHSLPGLMSYLGVDLDAKAVLCNVLRNVVPPDHALAEGLALGAADGRQDDTHGGCKEGRIRGREQSLVGELATLSWWVDRRVLCGVTQHWARTAETHLA